MLCMTTFRAEAERLAAERLLEEAKALIDEAKIRVDKDETEVLCLFNQDDLKFSTRLMSNFN